MKAGLLLGLWLFKTEFFDIQQGYLCISAFSCMELGKLKLAFASQALVPGDLQASAYYVVLQWTGTDSGLSKVGVRVNSPVLRMVLSLSLVLSFPFFNGGTCSYAPTHTKCTHKYMLLSVVSTKDQREQKNT